MAVLRSMAPDQGPDPWAGSVFDDPTPLQRLARLLVGRTPEERATTGLTLPAGFGATKIVNPAKAIPPDLVNRSVRSLGRDAMQAIRAMIHAGKLEPATVKPGWMQAEKLAAFQPPAPPSKAPRITLGGEALVRNPEQTLRHEIEHLRQYIHGLMGRPASDVTIKRRVLFDLAALPSGTPTETLLEGLAEATAGKAGMRERFPVMSEQTLADLLNILRQQRRAMRP